MSAANEKKASGGWRVLGIWVTLAFIGLVAAWFFLIKIASENAPEPVPIENSK